MTPTGPTELGKASLATDVTVSVSARVVVVAEADALKGNVRERPLRWVTVTCQTLKL